MKLTGKLGDEIRSKCVFASYNWEVVPKQIREAFYIRNMNFQDIGYVSAFGTIFVDLAVILDVYGELYPSDYSEEEYIELTEKVEEMLKESGLSINK